MRKIQIAGWPSVLAVLASLACGGGGGAPAPTLGTDASLSALAPSAGALSPAFAAGTTIYTLTVPFGTDTITLAATPRDPHAFAITVSKDGGAPAAVAIGEASPPLDVPALGSTSSLTVKVTAEDGRTQRTYALTLSRDSAVAPDPTLCGTAAATTPAVDASPGFPQKPVIPDACPGAVLDAAFAVDGATGLPVFTAQNDTARIQAAIDACAASLAALPQGAKGSVQLRPSQTTASLVAFVAGPLTLRAGVTLWVDEGATLFASQNPRDYDTTPGTPTCGTTGSSSSGCKPLIAVKGVAGAGVAGLGAIDGLGGEPMTDGTGGTKTWWDVAWDADATGKSFSNPRLIDVTQATGFTLHEITLRNSPKFHVGLGSDGFVVWDVHIQTPSRATNSLGKALTPAYARNTDGIDPYDASNGYIVYSTISTGDDQIALKCGHGKTDPTVASCRNITIAHDHLGTGHGISIGSETNAGKTDGTGVGVDGLHVYDVSIDGLIPNGGTGDVNVNGLRIKSDRSCGGIVRNVTYEDVCMRGLANPILLNPYYEPKATGNAVPTFEGVTFRNVRHVDCSNSAKVPTPVVTLFGADASHVTQVALDGVVVDGIAAGNVRASYASVALGPGPVNFAPSGTGVKVTGATGGGAPNACAGKFVALPAAR